MASDTLVDIRDSVRVTEANIESKFLRKDGEGLMRNCCIKYIRLGELLCSRRHNRINILASHSHEGLPPIIYHDWSMEQNENKNEKINDGRPNPAICSNCATSLADTSDRASAFWSHPRWVKGGYNS
jgi:hypothetical protein